MQIRKLYNCRQQFRVMYQILLAVMTTLSFTMEFGCPDYIDIDFTVSREFLVNLKESLVIDSFKSTAIFVLILLFSVKTHQIDSDKMKFKTYKLFYVCCMIIGFIWLMAKSFVIDNSMANLYITKGQIIKSIIYYVGTVNLLVLLGKFVFALVDHGKSTVLFYEYSKTEIKRSMYGTFTFLMVMWLPHIIMAYPASIISDAWSQLSMFYRRKTFTSHHPPFHTWVIGMAVRLGEKIGSANMGLFLFILIQSIIFAVVITYGIMTMKRLGAPKWLIILTEFVAVTSPYYTAYIGLITKDTLYSYFFLLFLIELIYLINIPRGGVLGKQ